MSNKIVCQGCVHFYITYRVKRPWGCKKFGFLSKNLPYQEVLLTTGMECAYRKEKILNNKIKNRGGL